MTMNNLIRDIYKVILNDVAGYCLSSDAWEEKNGERLENEIRQLITNVVYPDFAFTDPLPIPPPNWKSVHIGEGVSVPTENPELECKVAR